MQEVQRRTKTPTSRDDLGLIASDPQARMSGLQAFRGGPEEGTGIPSRIPVPVPAGPMGSPQAGPMPVPTQAPTAGTQVLEGTGIPHKMSSLTDGLKKVGPLAAAVLAEKATRGSEIKKGLDEQERMARQAPSLQDIGGGALGFNPRTVTAADGGLIGMAAGGEFMGRVPGDGHGMEDNVYMPIREGKKDVGTLAVSPSEYVVDSYTMAALGNGNADEGADIMDEVVEGVRERAYGNRKQPNEINGLAALRPMLERV